MGLKRNSDKNKDVLKQEINDLRSQMEELEMKAGNLMATEKRLERQVNDNVSLRAEITAVKANSVPKQKLKNESIWVRLSYWWADLTDNSLVRAGAVLLVMLGLFFVVAGLGALVHLLIADMMVAAIVTTVLGLAGLVGLYKIATIRG